MITAIILGLLLTLLCGVGVTDALYETASFPAWLRDYSGREHILPGGIKLDSTAFPRRDSVKVTASAATVAGAVAQPVTALTGEIPAGTIIAIGGTFVTLTAKAVKGATSLTVSATPANIANASTGTYLGTGKVFVRGGKLVGRTFAERAAKAPFGPWADGDDEVFLTFGDVYDAQENSDAEAVRPGSLIAENLLPDWATLTAPEKAVIRATFTSTIGQP